MTWLSRVILHQVGASRMHAVHVATRAFSSLHRVLPSRWTVMARLLPRHGVRSSQLFPSYDGSRRSMGDGSDASNEEDEEEQAIREREKSEWELARQSLDVDSLLPSRRAKSTRQYSFGDVKRLHVQEGFDAVSQEDFRRMFMEWAGKKMDLSPDKCETCKEIIEVMETYKHQDAVKLDDDLFAFLLRKCPPERHQELHDYRSVVTGPGGLDYLEARRRRDTLEYGSLNAIEAQGTPDWMSEYNEDVEFDLEATRPYLRKREMDSGDQFVGWDQDDWQTLEDARDEWMEKRLLQRENNLKELSHVHALAASGALRRFFRFSAFAPQYRGTRPPVERKQQLQFHIDELQMGPKAKAYFVALIGTRLNEKTGVVKITSDKFPSPKENLDSCLWSLEQLLREAWSVEDPDVPRPSAENPASSERGTLTGHLDSIRQGLKDVEMPQEAKKELFQRMRDLLSVEESLQKKIMRGQVIRKEDLPSISKEKAAQEQREAWDDIVAAVGNNSEALAKLEALFDVDFVDLIKRYAWQREINPKRAEKGRKTYEQLHRHDHPLQGEAETESLAEDVVTSLKAVAEEAKREGLLPEDEDKMAEELKRLVPPTTLAQGLRTLCDDVDTRPVDLLESLRSHTQDIDVAYSALPCYLQMTDSEAQHVMRDVDLAERDRELVRRFLSVRVGTVARKFPPGLGAPHTSLEVQALFRVALSSDGTLGKWNRDLVLLQKFINGEQLTPDEMERLQVVCPNRRAPASLARLHGILQQCIPWAMHKMGWSMAEADPMATDLANDMQTLSAWLEMQWENRSYAEKALWAVEEMNRLRQEDENFIPRQCERALEKVRTQDVREALTTAKGEIAQRELFRFGPLGALHHLVKELREACMVPKYGDHLDPCSRFAMDRLHCDWTRWMHVVAAFGRLCARSDEVLRHSMGEETHWNHEARRVVQATVRDRDVIPFSREEEREVYQREGLGERDVQRHDVAYKEKRSYLYGWAHLPEMTTGFSLPPPIHVLETKEPDEAFTLLTKWAKEEIDSKESKGIAVLPRTVEEVTATVHECRKILDRWRKQVPEDESVLAKAIRDLDEVVRDPQKIARLCSEIRTLKTVDGVRESVERLKRELVGRRPEEEQRHRDLQKSLDRVLGSYDALATLRDALQGGHVQKEEDIERVLDALRRESLSVLESVEDFVLPGDEKAPSEKPSRGKQAKHKTTGETKRGRPKGAVDSVKRKRRSSKASSEGDTSQT